MSFSSSYVLFLVFVERFVFSFQKSFGAGVTLIDLKNRVSKPLFSACSSIFSKNIASMDKKLELFLFFAKQLQAHLRRFGRVGDVIYGQ